MLNLTLAEESSPMVSDHSASPDGDEGIDHCCTVGCLSDTIKDSEDTQRVEVIKDPEAKYEIKPTVSRFGEVSHIVQHKGATTEVVGSCRETGPLYTRLSAFNADYFGSMESQFDRKSARETSKISNPQIAKIIATRQVAHKAKYLPKPLRFLRVR
jgi:hypothetical protein